MTCNTMAPDFRSYLVTQVIAEKNTVSYRNVSRALKVHVNAAKCMLYEFYQTENKKNPGSIYATYLIAGTKKNVKQVANGKTNGVDEDETMASSPPPFTSSMLEPPQQIESVKESDVVSRRTITLAREAVLSDIRSQYENITSIHIYSISPGRLADIVALTIIGQELFVGTIANGDPLRDNKIYGVIQNADVRRRKGKRPAIPDAPAPRFHPVKAEKTETSAEKEHGSKQITSNATSREGSRPSSRDGKSTLKRDSSNLFKAFAKQSGKPKLSRQGTDTSTNASASGAEDVNMRDADDEGESDDEALFPKQQKTTSGTSKKRPIDIKKESEEGTAKLRKMMDSDEEEEDDKKEDNEDKHSPKEVTMSQEDNESEADTKAGQNIKTEAETGDEVDWSASDTEAKESKIKAQKDDESPPTTATGPPKRRRVKRKVVKKRTMKDEDGYLVTKEEEVLESFSEDEPEPTSSTLFAATTKQKASSTNPFAKAAKKPTTSTSASSSQNNNSSQQTTKSDGTKKKGGDGSIKNFFGRK